MAVLSKAGCASGPCHGNRSGKGGFKLSLRGEDPEADYLTLTTGLAGRRLNFENPEQSLLLLKPTTEVAHEGGRRFAPGSSEYEILRRWVAQRAPDDHATSPARLEVTPAESFVREPAVRVPIRVQAHFPDGTHRDVTRLSVYESSQPAVAGVSSSGIVERLQPGETTVMVRYLQLQAPVRVAFIPPRSEFRSRGFPKSTNAVDLAVYAKLRRLRLNPSGPCSDEVFIRRASLDLLGFPPTGEEARAFVSDRRVDKRDRWVDAMLERPEFAEFWALKWADLLRLDERTLDDKGARQFYDWIRTSIQTHQPLDAFARDLVSTLGSTYDHPAANYYRNLRTPVERSEAAAQVWLGTRLQCAQCHNHPYERWTQDNYHDWTALFSRIDFQVLENRRRDDNDSHEFKGEQIVFVKANGEHRNPRTSRPAVARLLGAEAPVAVPGTNALADHPDARSWPTNAIIGKTELNALAGWLTATNNPLFARVQANRIWYHLMGRGLVEPIDDFRQTNPASHPELLDLLATHLVQSGYDTREVIRLILNSRTYQTTSEPPAGSGGDTANYSHTAVRRLTAEQLLDAQSRATGVPLDFAGFPRGTRAGQVPLLRTGGRRERSTLETLLTTFGKPPRQVPSECERTSEPAMTQAFALISGPTLNDFITSPDNRLGPLLESGKPPTDMVETLYWEALGRAPSDEERKQLIPRLAGTPASRRESAEDLLWGLLNAKEFVLRY